MLRQRSTASSTDINPAFDLSLGQGDHGRLVLNEPSGFIKPLGNERFAAQSQQRVGRVRGGQGGCDGGAVGDDQHLGIGP